MNNDVHDSSAFVANSSSRYQHAPYGSTLRYMASSSSASVLSDSASQSSDDTSASSNTSDSDSCDSCCLPQLAVATTSNVVNHQHAVQQPRGDKVPAELRRNPRRSAPGSHPGRGGHPPALVRQSDRKVLFVDILVDCSTQVVEAIWPLSSAVCQTELGSKAVLPLRTFIQETLRRSRTSYSTLQVALYYLILIKPHVPKHDPTTEHPSQGHADRALECGRRMFLAALILASKYLQDRNYSARAWSKISGLNTLEINQNEIAFLLAVNWKLHISDDVFKRWTEIVLTYTSTPSSSMLDVFSQQYAQHSAEWKRLILRLDPDLGNFDGALTTPPAGNPASDLCVLSPRSILNFPQEGRGSANAEASMERSAAPDPSSTTTAPEDRVPKTTYPMGNLASDSSLPLPAPGLISRTAGLYTPAVSSACRILGRSNAMGLTNTHTSGVGTSQTNLYRSPYSVSSSTSGPCPCPCPCPLRRSSLANSLSAASSPESMVSDSSRSSAFSGTSATSRSSSISSASSLASATCSHSRGGLPLRPGAAKLRNDRVSVKPSVSSVPENCGEEWTTSLPECQVGCAETALVGMHLSTTAPEAGVLPLEAMVLDSASKAAIALQDLHNHDLSCKATPTQTGLSRKRGRTTSMDGCLQNTVREMLDAPTDAAEPVWLALAHSHDPPGKASVASVKTRNHAGFEHNVKRVCCSTEAAKGYHAAGVHPAMSLRERGTWDGILN